MKKLSYVISLAILFLCASLVVRAADDEDVGSVPPPIPSEDRALVLTSETIAKAEAEAQQIPAPVEREEVSVGEKILWYIPNRLMDIVDIFRVRAKVGPGLAAGVRLTDHASFYVGRQHSAWVGLPGARYPQWVRWPVGFENQRGVVVASVDASDDVRNPPHYGFTETNVNLHLLIVGAEVGIDPLELSDFFLGWFMYDVGRDDFPRKPAKLPETGSLLRWKNSNPEFPVESKPAEFPSFSSRLDYIHRNVPNRMHGHVRYWDLKFVPEGQEAIRYAPSQNLSLALYTKTVLGASTSFELKPDLEMDIDLPNMEHSLRLFIDSSSDDDLPGLDPVDREDSGLTVGGRKIWDRLYLSFDLGVRAKWLPEVYARVRWRPDWKAGSWFFRPEQRLFWESDDGFGTLTSLNIHKWFHDTTWMFKSTSAVKITEKDDFWRWEQTIGIGKALKLRREKDRGKNISRDDALNSYGIRCSVFGNDDEVREYRGIVSYRFPIYEEFIVLAVDPGIQWREQEEWDEEYRLDLGLEMHF